MGSNRLLLYTVETDSNLDFFPEVKMGTRLGDDYTFDHYTPNRQRASYRLDMHTYTLVVTWYMQP